MAYTSATKSIDVGSMFLMDLSVGESDLNGDSSDIITVDKDLVFSSGYHIANPTYQPNDENKSTHANQLMSRQSIAYRRQESQHDYLGSSLDRLASAIDGDNQYLDTKDGKNTSSVTIVEPQPPPDIAENQSSSSLSDGSYVASTGSSLSASYTASSEPDDEAVERGSTTTREDSGVLDIKDLEGQLNYFYNDDEQSGEELGRGTRQTEQEKPISKNNKATNLIIMSANNNNDHNTSSTMQLPDRSNNEPTNDNNVSNNHHNHHNHHHNHHHHHNQRTMSSKRSMSASLPIEVPARQMKKDLKKSKMISSKNQIADLYVEDANEPSDSMAHKVHGNEPTTKSPAFDDDDFLEQEYNANHHNHYPIDEYDDEQVRAEDNPMKLFESIQALARSLHEDTELFGSLPPKRMLESPIRSLALV